MLAQIHAVRGLGLQVRLATVQEHERAAYLWDDMGLGGVCDAIHYAADLGSAKPSDAFYAAVEARTGFTPSDILFIDDSQRNVAAARKLGWRAELWRPGSSLVGLFPELA